MKEPRTKPAEVRLDELMNAAETLFLAQGTQATTVSQIVEAAGVAKGTFYHYFPSKSAILEALQLRYTEQFLAKVEAAVMACAGASWENKLERMVEASVEQYYLTHQFHDVIFHQQTNYERQSYERHPFIEAIESLLVAGAEANAWAMKSSRFTAVMIYSGMHDCVDYAIDQKLPQQDAAAEIVFLIRKLLAKESSKKSNSQAKFTRSNGKSPSN